MDIVELRSADEYWKYTKLLNSLTRATGTFNILILLWLRTGCASVAIHLIENRYTQVVHVSKNTVKILLYLYNSYAWCYQKTYGTYMCRYDRDTICYNFCPQSKTVVNQETIIFLLLPFSVLRIVAKNGLKAEVFYPERTTIKTINYAERTIKMDWKFQTSDCSNAAFHLLFLRK